MRAPRNNSTSRTSPRVLRSTDLVQVNLVVRHGSRCTTWTNSFFETAGALAADQPDNGTARCRANQKRTLSSVAIPASITTRASCWARAGPSSIGSEASCLQGRPCRQDTSEPAHEGPERVQHHAPVVMHAGIATEVNVRFWFRVQRAVPLSGPSASPSKNAVWYPESVQRHRVTQTEQLRSPARTGAGSMDRGEVRLYCYSERIATTR